MGAQVRIEDLNHPEGGHARIVFDGVGRMTVESILIRRFDQRENFLSVEGWRGAETPIQPQSVEAAGSAIAVVIGPDVTEWLDYGERIEVGLVAPGQIVPAQSGMALWPEIGSFTGHRRGRGRIVSGTAPRPRPAAVPPPPPRPAPPAPPTVIAPRPIPVPAAPPPPPAPAPAAARRRVMPIVAGLILLAALAGGGYYAYETWWKVPEDRIATPLSALDLASLVNRSPEEVFRMGETLWNQGSYDVALLLFEDSSRRGYGPAHTRIGKLYDPATFQAGRPFQRANARKALEHFDAAAAAGDAAARPLRQALVERLRETARGSDAPAREAQTIIQELRL
ncbi:MAG: hypothetical protein JNL66_10900 [Alphaproteobacteria bacterium]|nr:hypothetical protein [Alphaproteobacteria bacterium]